MVRSFALVTAIVIGLGVSAYADPGTEAPPPNIEYRFKPWIPWTVAGSGLAVVLGGVVMYKVGQSTMAQYDRDFAAACATGCEANLSMHPELWAERDRANLENKVGLGAVLVGTGAIVTGIVLAAINHPVRVVPSVAVTPHAAGAMVGAAWRF